MINRQIFRQTTRHDRIDGDFLDRSHGAHFGGIGPMTSCGSRVVAVEHSLDALRRRRHDGQAVTQLLLAKPVIDGFPAIFDFDDDWR